MRRRRKGLQGLDRDGRETEEGVEGKATESNVVRLPRDWLGPREELIPFGPRARESKPTALKPPPPEPTAQTEDSPLAPSPSDFWGEHSADMHHVLQGPDRDVGPPPGHGPPDSARRARLLQRTRSAARTGRLTRWRRWAERPAPESSPAPHSRRPSVRRSVAALAGLGVLITVVVAALGGNDGAPSHRSAQLRLPINDLLRGDLSAGRLRFPSRLAVAQHTRHVERRAGRPHRHSTPRSGARSPVRASTSASSTPSSSSGSTGATGTTTTPTVSTSASGAGSGSSSASGSSGSTSSSSGGRSSTGSGPVGPGAPFGPGHLG